MRHRPRRREPVHLPLAGEHHRLGSEDAVHAVRRGDLREGFYRQADGEEQGVWVRELQFSCGGADCDPEDEWFQNRQEDIESDQGVRV